MSEDPDLIARLYPVAWHTRSQVWIEDHPWCQNPYSRGSRESTASLTNQGNADTLPYIELRFSNIPRTSVGLVFGTDRDTCDLVLPSKVEGLSRRHFALTYRNNFKDGLYRLIVRDLGSTHGTTVAYDDKLKSSRRQFDWIVDGFDHVRKATMIIQPLPAFAFRLVVIRHDISSPVYIHNVERFRRGAAGPERLLGGLGLQSGPATQQNTNQHTAAGKQLLLPLECISRSSSEIVSRHWDASSGEYYTCKQPASDKYDKKAWEMRIKVMRQVSHGNIVRLCNLIPIGRRPIMVLEHMPLGSLLDAQRTNPFSDDECLVIFDQSLSALAYLHGKPEPIAHKHINLSNILVECRDPGRSLDRLTVKLADLGFPRPRNLGPIDDTNTYYPPEVWSGRVDARYATAMDIWSLAVVVFELVYRLPRPDVSSGKAWCEKIVKTAALKEDDRLLNILKKMMVMDPRERCSAVMCLGELQQLWMTRRNRSGAPGRTPASTSGFQPAEYASNRPSPASQRGPVDTPSPGEVFRAAGISTSLSPEPFFPNFSPAAGRASQPLGNPPRAPQPPAGYHSNLGSPQSDRNDWRAMGYNEAGGNGSAGYTFQPSSGGPTVNPSFLTMPSPAPARSPVPARNPAPPRNPAPLDRLAPAPANPPSPAHPSLRAGIQTRYPGYWIVQRPDGSAAAVYQPAERLINLTSVLKAANTSTSQVNYIIRRLSREDKVAIRRGPPSALAGTYLTFDRARELAIAMGFALLEEAVAVARADSERVLA